MIACIRPCEPATHHRIVVIEDGYSGFNRMPQPAEYDWTNVIYSYHSYPENPERLSHTLHDWESNDCEQRGVPFYIGEFSLAMHPDGFTLPEDLRQRHRRDGCERNFLVRLEFQDRAGSRRLARHSLGMVSQRAPRRSA